MTVAMAYEDILPVEMAVGCNAGRMRLRVADLSLN